MVREDVRLSLIRLNRNLPSSDKHRRFTRALHARDGYSGTTRYLDLGALLTLERELEPGARSGGRIEFHAHQPKEFNVGLFRNAVKAVDHDLGEMGEQFEQNHSGIAGRKIGPLFVARCAEFAFCHQLVECPVV